MTRYNLARLRIAQALIPVLVISTTLSRRLPGVWSAGLAVALLIVTGFALRSAINGLGKHPIRVERNAVWIGTTDLCVPGTAVTRWTFWSGVASLYCPDETFRLRALRGSESALEHHLTPLLGAPTMLRRRGSPRARLISGLVCISGILAVVGAFFLESMPLVVFGVPSVVLGFAAFMTMSQRVLANE